MKKLFRSRHNRVLAGICGGLSDYLNFDATIIRILLIILLVFTGFFPVGLIYIIMIFLVPNEESL